MLRPRSKNKSMRLLAEKLNEGVSTSRSRKAPDKKLNEQTGPLKRRIARLSIRLGSRMQFAEPEEANKIQAALHLLTQAMIVADTSEGDAERLFKQAKQISKRS